MVKIVYNPEYKEHFQQMFRKYPCENPITKYRIKKYGPTFKALVVEFGNPYKPLETPELVVSQPAITIPEDIITEGENIINEGVDVFDFKTYAAEHKLLSKYFDGLELMLRCALLIDYKYNHLAENDRNTVEEKLSTKKRKHRKAYLETVLDTFEPLYLITKWFSHFYPDKSQDAIVVTWNKYKHHLSVLFNRMYKKRIDPEWCETTKLWFD